MDATRRAKIAEDGTVVEPDMCARHGASLANYEAYNACRISIGRFDKHGDSLMSHAFALRTVPEYLR